MRFQPNRKQVIVSVVLGVFLILSAWFFSQVPLSRTEAMVNKPAPDMGYQTASGQSAKISDSQGKVVLLNFWAVWCAPCMEEMPSLRALEDHFGPQGFLLLAFDVAGDGESIRGQMDGRKYPKNLVFNFNKDNLAPYGVDSLPLSILIDREGLVKKVYRGPRQWMDTEIIRTIEQLL